MEIKTLVRSFATAAVLGFALNAQAKYGYVTDGLVAHWDAIDNQNTGSHVSSATTWVDLVGGASAALTGYTWEGNALYLNGTGGGVVNSTLLNWEGTDNANRTVEVVFRFYSATSSGLLVDGSKATKIGIGRVYYSGSGVTRMITSVGVSQPTILTTCGADFTSFSCGYVSGVAVEGNIYEDNVAKSFTTVVNNWSQSDDVNKIYIGCRGTSSTRFAGRIYSVRIYNRLLTADEVATNYAIDSTRFTLPEKTYVVPKGTEGNTPAFPYSSWATAANDPRTAADATVKNGTVYVLGGDYPSAYGIVPEQNVHVKIVATQSEQGEPGTMTMGQTLANHRGSPSSSDSRKFYVDYGTIRLNTGKDGNFWEYDSTWSCAATMTSIIASGKDSAIDFTPARTTYAGYTVLKYSMTVQNGASLYMNSCNAAARSGANGLRLSVLNGGSVTNNAGFTIGSTAGGDDDAVIISNGTLYAVNQMLFGSSTQSTRIGLTIAGERPYVRSGEYVSINGTNSYLTINVSEAPLDGYAERVLSSGVNTRAMLALATGSFTLDSAAKFNLLGIDQLASRVTNSGIETATWTLIKASNRLNVSDDQLAAARETLEDYPDFVLVKSINSLELMYKPVRVTYAVPPDTPNHTPVAPYTSWATASTNLRVAADCLIPHGTVMVAEGTYDSDYLSPEYAVGLRIVKSSTDENTPGVAKVTGHIAMGNTALINSDDYHSYTIAYGTYKPSGSDGNYFLEYPNGGSSVEAYNKFTVSGPNAYFDCADKNLYAIFITKHTTVKFTDHCGAKFKHLQVGTSGSANDGTFIVENYAAVTNTGSSVIGSGSQASSVIVDNAEYRTSYIDFGGSKDAGNVPRITTNHLFKVMNNGRLVITGTTTDLAGFTDRTRTSQWIFDNSTFTHANAGFVIANPGTNNVFTVRNGAKLQMKRFKVGAANRTTSGLRVEIDNAAIELSDVYEQNGDTTLVLDVSGVAIDGTAPKFLKAKTATVSSSASISLSGVQTVLDRMAAASPAVESLSLKLIETTDGLTIPDAIVTSLTGSLPSNARLVKSANTLKLNLGKSIGFIVLAQ